MYGPELDNQGASAMPELAARILELETLATRLSDILIRVTDMETRVITPTPLNLTEGNPPEAEKAPLVLSYTEKLSRVHADMFEYIGGIEDHIKRLESAL